MNKLIIFKCRNYARTKSWIEYIVAHPAIAAELYAEHTWAEDGSIITVMNHGKYTIGRRIVVYKIGPPSKGGDE